MPRILALGLAGALLASCAEYSAGSAAVRSEGKLVAAEALNATLWGICRAATVGSIIDRFGQNPETWTAYNRLCLGYRQADGPPEPLVK